MKKQKKTKRFNILLTEQEYKIIKKIANELYDGNISMLLRQAALMCARIPEEEL